jgi:mycothiol synthase
VIRRAETDTELERCVEIFNAVHPDDRIALRDIQISTGFCLLHPGGGYAYLSSSSTPAWQYTMVRVQPGARRQGVGKALLAAATEVARAEGIGGLVGRVVDPDDDESRGWAAKGGFRETRQDVELLRRLRPGDGEVAEDVVPMCADHLRGAYAVEVECVPDVPATTPIAAYPFERHLYGQRHRLEHGLTAVLRSHRGRGVATRLKGAQIAWAAHHGYTELITATDTTNGPMRRVSAKLGYAERLGSIIVEREL